jgi:RNA polymerase sigma factor, sigma-70 family
MNSINVDVNVDTNMKETRINNMLEVNNNFYEKYNPKIRAVVTRILTQANQARDIDDCVNNVYLELMGKLQQYNEVRGSLEAFVTIIARSTALDYCRSHTKINTELGENEKIDFLSDGINIENKVEFQSLVEEILQKLNKEDRALFTMKYILYYSSAEIAKNLKINRGTVDMRVSRLKSKVKKFLTKGGILI